MCKVLQWTSVKLSDLIQVRIRLQREITNDTQISTLYLVEYNNCDMYIWYEAPTGLYLLIIVIRRYYRVTKATSLDNKSL